MAHHHEPSILLPLLLITLSLMSGKEVLASRHLVETTLPTVPELPKVELPPLPTLPTLPKFELPPLPHVPTLEEPQLPTLPKPELPTVPHVPALEKPELPELPNSPWVSPTQVVPKKSGITVVQNDKGEDVSTRLTTGWKVCIDYRRLNVVIRKDHFPLPFIDQAVEAPRIPSFEGGEATRPSSPTFQRKYETKRPPTTPRATTSRPESLVRRPEAKRAKTSGPGESSRASKPSKDSELPSDMSLESIIRRPMVTTLPIEGNSNYRARPFHSKLYFDQKAMRQKLEL
ncbi:protein PELPK1-like [Vitis riparia]|uniref:protein PELPK1-like n=1 Tax=Vitis riparia TaxID=96939 RepID=UPI00155A74A2|nr:protein PELPK1-like [Vitis riparia]